MRFTSRHITPLVFNSLGRGHTHAHTRTRIPTIRTGSILRNQARAGPGRRAPGLMKSIADIIITNNQWVFENLTQIVKVAKTNGDITNDLRCNGRLNKQVIDCIDWKLVNNVDQKYFLKLLERLAIISPTKRTDAPSCLVFSKLLPLILLMNNIY